jgi:hypothetical protein
VEHSRSTVRKGFEIVSWVVSKYPLSIVVKSICLSMSSDHCLKGFKLRNESTSTDHKIILDHVRSYLIPGVASFIPDSAMQGTAGMEIKLDNEPARNHISGIIELHIRTANDKYKSSEPEYLPPPLPEQHSHADHHLASKDANGTHHLHVETGDAHPVVSFHPEPATVRTSSPATGELKHILPMRCACTRKSGMCAAPIDPSVNHTIDCHWVCCGQTWSNKTCQLTPEQVAARLQEPPGVLQFFGHKKGHVSTARQLRYFVCEQGELKYYASKLNVAPYGKDLKG